MGYWGIEIYESDTALCTLGDLLQPFIDVIEKNAKDPTAAEWDELEPHELVISMSLILTLKQAGIPIEHFPNSKILENNRESFRTKWVEYAELEDNQFQVDRLDPILAIWDRMIIVSKNAEKQSSS